MKNSAFYNGENEAELMRAGFGILRPVPIPRGNTAWTPIGVGNIKTDPAYPSYFSFLVHAALLHSRISFPKPFLSRLRLPAKSACCAHTWPYVPLHGLAIFDGQTGRSIGQIFTLEGAAFDDAKFFLARAREARKGIDNFRKRDNQDQLAMLAFARAALTTTFHFLEGYLNGLAYDCFQEHHNSLPPEDHDLLAEWDSKKKKHRFVSFERKIFEYPQVVAKAYGKKLDLLDFEPAKLLAKEGKDIRDALTHPSPYVFPKSGVEEKTFWATGAGFEAAEQIFNAAKDYVLVAEQGVGKDPKKTMPWFFE